MRILPQFQRTDNVRIVRVTGDSMEPAIANGGFIFWGTYSVADHDFHRCSALVGCDKVDSDRQKDYIIVMGFGYFSDYASCGVDDTESGDDICSGQTDSTGPVAPT